MSTNAILEATKETKESKEFDTVKQAYKKEADVAKQTILNVCLHIRSRRVTRDAVRKKHREPHDMFQYATEREVSTNEFDAIRSKVYNFHCVQLIITARLKTNNLVIELN